MSEPHYLLKAMLWKLLDSFILSVLLLLGTLLAKDSNPLQVVFLVNLLAATFAIICCSHGQWQRIKPSKPSLHFIRGLLGVTSTVCLLWALQYLHFAEVTAIGFLTPALTAVLALWLFGEQKRWTDFIVLALNMVGVFLILSPYLSSPADMSDQNSWIGILFSLLAVLLLVIYNINLKKIGEQDTVVAQMVFGPLCSACLLLPLMYWWWQPLSLQAWGLLGLYGALLTVKLAARYWSFQQSQLSRLMPLEYSQMLFSAALGYLFLGQSLGALAIAGILVILCSSLTHLWRNSLQELPE
ncbi:TPA: DMT family transporter [Aeromonas sobria]|nr:DMT family transporter [Aeromonas sobria]